MRSININILHDSTLIKVNGERQQTDQVHRSLNLATQHVVNGTQSQKSD